MSCRVKGEASRSDLETALRALGEVVSWKQLPCGKQWQHRCSKSQYNRTVLSWYSGTGAVVCQGQHKEVLQKHLEDALCGRPKMPPNVEIKPAPKTELSDASKGKAKTCLDSSKRFSSASREAIDAGLRLMGEEPSWQQLSDTHHQHRFKESGRYGRTALNWASSTGRIWIQGLNSAALEENLRKAMRSSPNAGPKPAPALPVQPPGAACFFIGTPALSQATPASKVYSTDDNNNSRSTSTGSPSDDSDSSPQKESQMNVKLLAKMFNDRIKASQTSVTIPSVPFPYPYPYPAGGLMETKPGLTRSASAPASGFTPQKDTDSLESPNQKTLTRSRSCAVKPRIITCEDHSLSMKSEL